MPLISSVDDHTLEPRERRPRSTGSANAADTDAFLRGSAIEAFGLDRFGIHR